VAAKDSTVRARRQTRAAVRVLVVAALAVIPLVVSWPRASAAVAPEPAAVAPGNVVTIGFQVVNDRAPHATTRVEIDFPIHPAIVNADAVPVPGWTVRMDRRPLAHPVPTPDGPAGDAVRRLVWTGGPLTGANLVRFTIDAGPIPSSVGTIGFTAVQTYDDGVVVRWHDDPSKQSASHPAPYLDVSRFAATRPAAAAAPLDAAFNLDEKRAIDRRVRLLVRNGEVATPDDLESARWLSLLAVVVGLAGLALGGAAFLAVRRARRDGALGPRDPHDAPGADHGATASAAPEP